MANKNPVLIQTDQICPNCGAQYLQSGPSHNEVDPYPTNIRVLVEQQKEIPASQLGSASEDCGCRSCFLFEELAPALRLSIGTLRNWKYEGFLTPVHSIGRRPHFRLEQVREELRRNGKIR